MIYGLLSALGAFVLFLFEPFLGKVLTPRFGGGANVWIVCLLFFQVVLLAGYTYAHELSSRVPSWRRQVRIHVGLLLLVVGSLAWRWMHHGNPLIPEVDPAGRQEAGSLLWLLATTSALPMTALAATSPLMQAWYRHTSTKHSPYRLYVWSNAGSLGGLLAYPFAAEPLLSTPLQGILIFFLILLFVGSVLTLRKNGTEDPGQERDPVGERVSDAGALDRSGKPHLWVLASAAGSMILMASTNKMTLEIAAIPLLWILPLVAYLATFIIVFDGKWNWTRGPWPMVWMTLFAASVVIALAAPRMQIYETPLLIAGGTAATFSGCMVCHGYLYECRPEAARLTRFYLWVAVGGVLGGLCVALVAPVLFNRLFEFGCAILAVGSIGFLLARRQAGRLAAGAAATSLLGLGVGAFALWSEGRNPGIYLRNFYGIVRVSRVHNLLMMDNIKTLHGFIDLARPTTPLSYYTPDSGIGHLLNLQMAEKPSLKVGIVGLGTGSVVVYGRSTDEYVFYEINPLVNALAGPQSKSFRLLRDAKARVELVEGDGRVCLEQELKAGRSRGFDVLLIDAFSGDSVPWHLLTVEAFQCYFAHLAPDGVLALHVSNALPVDRIALGGAKALNLFGVYLKDPMGRPGPMNPWHMGTQYVLLSRDPKALNHPSIYPATVAVFGPATFQQAEAGSGSLSFLRSDRPWRDQRNSLSQLVFKRRAIDEIGIWNRRMQSAGTVISATPSIVPAPPERAPSR